MSCARSALTLDSGLPVSLEDFPVSFARTSSNLDIESILTRVGAIHTESRYEGSEHELEERRTHVRTLPGKHADKTNRT